MTASRRLSGWAGLAWVVAFVLFASAGPAAPAELTAYVSGASPTSSWNAGYGGMLTITLFNIVHGDAELGWQAGDASGTGVLLVAAKAYVGPTIDRIVPYVGLGVGYYAEGKPGDDKAGSLGELFVGMKVKLPLGFLLRGELQRTSLGSSPPIPLDTRFFLGAGISF
jgi:hypothetical protein